MIINTINHEAKQTSLAHAGIDLGAEYSSLFGTIASVGYETMFTDTSAVHVRLRAGSNLRDVLINAGITFAEEKGEIILTAREIQNRRDFFTLPTDTDKSTQWVRARTFGVQIQYQLSNLKLGAYGVKTVAPSVNFGSTKSYRETVDFIDFISTQKRLAGSDRTELGLSVE